MLEIVMSHFKNPSCSKTEQECNLVGVTPNKKHVTRGVPEVTYATLISPTDSLCCADFKSPRV